MEKSIESIWKEGFLNKDQFIAPKLTNLYNKKSEHIVDKFTRMLKINLITIVAGSFFILGISWTVKIPYMGIGFFILLNTHAIINFKLMQGLHKIDKNMNSYQYLKSFDDWLKEMISLNQKFARVLYPLILLSIIAGFWFGTIGEDIPGDFFVNKLIVQYPEMLLVFGIPIYLLLGLMFIMALLAFTAGQIFKWDLYIIYGRVIEKLDEILKDMEELRA